MTALTRNVPLSFVKKIEFWHIPCTPFHNGWENVAEKNISHPLAIENFSNKEKNLFKPALGISLDLCFIVLYVRFIELLSFRSEVPKGFWNRWLYDLSDCKKALFKVRISDCQLIIRIRITKIYKNKWSDGSCIVENEAFIHCSI